MQVYADLRVITARPDARDEARAPHMLYGYVDGATAHNAAQWAADARAAIAQVHEAGGIPILVGGTGLYIRTLINGIAPVPEIDSTVRAAVRALPLTQARAELTRLDPDAAARLHANDDARTRRALEVIRSTGRPLAAWQKSRVDGIADQVRLTPLILVPPRDWLAERAAARFANMLEDGQAEARAVIARNLSPALPMMRAIGLNDVMAYVAGKVTREAALASGTAATRAYAKRQATWFAHQPPGDWPRHAASLDSQNIDDLAIILHKSLLTL